MSEPPKLDEYTPYPKLMFFPVGILKLVLMSAVTLGLYELYWFYKNWKFIQKRSQVALQPFWRAFFGVLYCYPCFKEIEKEVKSKDLPFPLSAGWLAFLWIVLTITWRLPDPYWVVTYLATIVLIPVQNAVNRLNSAVEPNHDPNTSYSGWNIFGLVLGGLLFALGILGLFLPEP